MSHARVPTRAPKRARVLLLGGVAALFALATPASVGQTIRVTQAWDGSPVVPGSTCSFPDTGISVPVSRQFTIWNDGPQELTLLSPDRLVSGTGWSQIGDPPSTVIPAGGSTPFSVRLESTAAGTFDGKVTVETASSLQLPYRFNVTGAVSTPDFELSVAPAQQSFSPGENVGYTVSVTGYFGFTEPVSLAVIGLPAASSAAWTLTSVAPGGSSELRVSASGSTPVGLYALSLTGTSGVLSRSLVVFLNVRTTVASRSR